MFSILQWAWTFDPAHTSLAFTLPFRFYAYSATSILLWLYELLPHWILLTLLILGAFTVLAIALFIFCYPFPSTPSMLYGHLQAFPPAISVCGCGYRSYWVLAIFAALRNPKGLPSTPVSTSFRGPYSSCSHTACYLRSNNGCISSSSPDQGLPGSSS